MSDCDECGRAFTTAGGPLTGRTVTIYYETVNGDLCPPCYGDLKASNTCLSCGTDDALASEWGSCVNCTFEEHSYD